MKFISEVERHQTLMVGDRVCDEAGSYWEVVERLIDFPYFVLKNCLGGKSVLAYCSIEDEPHQHKYKRCHLILVESDDQRLQQHLKLRRKAS